eukprot:1422712-Rhodomonas_salina.4
MKLPFRVDFFLPKNAKATCFKFDEFTHSRETSHCESVGVRHNPPKPVWGSGTSLGYPGTRVPGYPGYGYPGTWVPGGYQSEI